MDDGEVIRELILLATDGDEFHQTPLGLLVSYTEGLEEYKYHWWHICSSHTWKEVLEKSMGPARISPGFFEKPI